MEGSGDTAIINNAGRWRHHRQRKKPNSLQARPQAFQTDLTQYTPVHRGCARCRLGLGRQSASHRSDASAFASVRRRGRIERLPISRNTFDGGSLVLKLRCQQRHHRQQAMVSMIIRRRFRHHMSLCRMFPVRHSYLPQVEYRQDSSREKRKYTYTGGCGTGAVGADVVRQDTALIIPVVRLCALQECNAPMPPGRRTRAFPHPGKRKR